jgi:hypothetical protein
MPLRCRRRGDLHVRPGPCSAARGSVFERDGVMEGGRQRQTRGPTITVSVVSDAAGAYNPAGRLEPGPTRLSIGAAGYELAGPGRSISRRGAGTLDLKLKPAARAPVKSHQCRMDRQRSG